MTLTGLLFLDQPSTASPPSGDEVALVEPNGRWHIQVPGYDDYTFWYGMAGDILLLGDWNGDGIDTPGAWRQGSGGGFAYLTNTLPEKGQVGVADFTFYFGNPGDQVMVGDWNGDGVDTLGINRNGHIFLTNTNGSGGAPVPTHHEFWFGTPGDRAFGGDGNGDGKDSVFLYRPSGPGAGYVYYTNERPGWGAVAKTAAYFYFGVASDRFVAGDWNTDGVDTAGIFRPGNNTVYLSNTNVSGGAAAPTDVSYVWGHPQWVPVAGWTGVNAPPTTTTTSTTTTTTSTTTTIPPPQGLPIRVNAGGPQINSPDGHHWQADTTNNPSPYLNFIQGDPENRGTTWPTPGLDSSVPPGTPTQIFTTERYDNPGSRDMHWNIPVDADQWIEIRLYFASGYPGASDVAERMFDVTIDDWLVLDDYDIVADVGHQTGVMKRFIVRTDPGGLDISFSHTDPVSQNPLINAIEVLAPSRLRVVSAGADTAENGMRLLNTIADVASYPKGPGTEWIIKIEPGTYVLSETLTLQPHVEIEGSGAKRTTVARSLPGTYAAGTEFIDSAIVYGADKAVVRQLAIEASGGDWARASYGILSVRGSPRFEAISVELYQGSHTAVRISGGRPHLRDIAITTPQKGGYVTGLEILNSQLKVGNVDLSTAAHDAGGAAGIRVLESSTLDLSHARIRTDNLKWSSLGFGCNESSIRLKDVVIEAYGSAGPTALSVDSCDAELENVHATTSGGWGESRRSGGYFWNSVATISNSSFTALGHSAHMVALTASESTVTVTDTGLHAASTGTPVYGAWITDSTVTMTRASLDASDGDPPFLMTVTGSSVTITDSTITSLEDTYSTGRGMVVDDGALPLNVVIEDTTVIAPDWIATNNSTGTVIFRRSTLDGGPMLGTGSVSCQDVWDEHGTFYPNTCPN
jgi:hypothetical protein